jgi:rhodanese-related sulfurtransferase
MIDISAEEFKNRLPELQIVDIRTEAEVLDFDLGGLHLPFDELLEKLDMIDFLKIRNLSSFATQDFKVK